MGVRIHQWENKEATSTLGSLHTCRMSDHFLAKKIKERPHFKNAVPGANQMFSTIEYLNFPQKCCAVHSSLLSTVFPSSQLLPGQRPCPCRSTGSGVGFNQPPNLKSPTFAGLDFARVPFLFSLFPSVYICIVCSAFGVGNFVRTFCAWDTKNSSMELAVI